MISLWDFFQKFKKLLFSKKKREGGGGGAWTPPAPHRRSPWCIQQIGKSYLTKFSSIIPIHCYKLSLQREVISKAYYIHKAYTYRGRWNNILCMFIKVVYCHNASFISHYIYIDVWTYASVQNILLVSIFVLASVQREKSTSQISLWSTFFITCHWCRNSPLNVTNGTFILITSNRNLVGTLTFFVTSQDILIFKQIKIKTLDLRRYSTKLNN